MNEANSILKQRASAWALRLLLGTAYFTLGEVLLWNNPDFGMWPFRLAGCVLLAALVLDILVRFHVRDVPGLLMASGVFGLLYGLLIVPDQSDELLRLIVLRPLGWYSLAGGGLGFAWAALLLRGARFRVVWAAIVGGLGLLWGIWIRWYPAQLPDGSETSLIMALAIGAAALAAPGMVAYVTRHAIQKISVETYLMMERWEWAVFGGGVAMLVGMNLDDIAALGVGALVMLGGFILGVLYFMRTRSRRSLMRGLLPPRLVNWAHYTALILVFLVGEAAGYLVPPLGNEAIPAQITWLITLLYNLGFLWLPATAIIMAVRLFIDLSREGL